MMKLLLKEKPEMGRKGKSKTGQATMELAIFGSVAMLILAALINYGQTLAMQQQLEMYAFRRALQLSRARKQDGAARQVGFTVFREVYPVALLAPGVERQRLSGSASINWESDSGTLTGEDPEDFSADYWQLGGRQIKNHEMIELPKMKVNRDIDKSEVRGFLESVINFFLTGGGEDDMDMWVSVPVEGAELNALSNATSRQNTTETAGITTNSARDWRDENNVQTLVIQSDAKIKQWDPKINTIYEKPSDIVIGERERVIKNKHWETPVR